MEKIIVGLSYDFLSINNTDFESVIDFEAAKTLSDTVKYLTQNNNEVYFCLSTEEDLSDKKVRMIAQKLASAIDKNSVEEVKALKKEYGDIKEFSKAKNFLNNKCKEVWNVHESDNITVPIEAMKVLGITNRPSLEALLYESVKYFERDNGTTTVQIIENILNNKNLVYTIEDVHKYLVQMKNKRKM